MIDSVPFRDARQERGTQRMVHLTEYEKKMLQGEFGPFRQAAMKVIYDYAAVLGAEELCVVRRATLFIGAHHYLDSFAAEENYETMFSRFCLNQNTPIPFTRMAPECAVQTCAAACDLFDYEATHLGKEFVERNNHYLDATSEIGVSIVNACTPYYVGWVPLAGEHFVTNESSNTLMSNSMFGAYGNADGVETAVCAAITGRTPQWGMHIKENRYGDVLIQVETQPDDAFDWDLLGYTIGRYLPPHGKPVLQGNFIRPDVNMLRQCFSALASTSAAEICHIVGVTPEARSIADALGGKEPRCTITITKNEIEASLAMLCDDGHGPVDLVSIGCPHLSLEELRDLAWALEDQKVADGTDFWIWTDYATQHMAQRSGYIKKIEKSGAKVLNSSCPLVMRERSHRRYHAMVMSGAKQAHNIRSQTDTPVYFGNTKACIQAAIRGYWGN